MDDGSTDATRRIVAEFGGVTGIAQTNGGPAKARNTGWRASSASIVVFTDSDCVPDEHWIERLLAGFSEAAIGAVTGSYGIANAEFLLPRLIHEEIKDRHRRYRSHVKFFGSYNVALRRSVLEATGGFDESYRRASAEDNDLSYRVLAAGRSIAFAPDALVGHHHTRSLAKYLREQFTHGCWRMKLYRAHPGMTGGDDYTRVKDALEVPVAVACLAAIPAATLVPLAAPSLLAALLLMQLPAAGRIAYRTRDARYLILAPVTLLRAFARGLGLTVGVMRFVVAPMAARRPADR